ncbi:MAG: hypothetical protein ACE366_19205 [Bradymonadia bacterium]
MTSSSAHGPAPATVNAAFCDGLDEAARGLWPSARESFQAAFDDDPVDPRPALALAICWLKLGDPQHAVVILESSPCLNPPPARLQRYHQWLCAAARHALGDPMAAAKALAGLPWRRHLQFEAHERLTNGDLQGGVMALLEAMEIGGAALD